LYGSVLCEWLNMCLERQSIGDEVLDTMICAIAAYQSTIAPHNKYDNVLSRKPAMPTSPDFCAEKTCLIPSTGYGPSHCHSMVLPGGIEDGI